MSGRRATDISPGEQTIDAPRLLAGIRRRWRWVAYPTLIAAIGSTAFVLTATPRYTGVAKVLLEDQEGYYTRPDKAQGLDPATTIDAEAVQSEAESAASTDLARRTIETLGLAHNPEFSPAGAGDSRVVDRFLQRLTVFPVPRSRVLQIEFVSRNPALAARGANAVAETFLQSRLEAKTAAAKAASDWLSPKIDDLRARVADADAKVEAFRAQSGLLAGANGQTVSSQQLTDLNAQLATARSAEAAAEAKVELLRRLQAQGRLGEAPASITDESMRRLTDQRAGLRAQIAEASRTLLPLHPRMKELNAQLAGLDAQIQDAGARNVRFLDNEAKLAADHVASLSAALAEQSKTVATGNADDVHLRELQMEAKAARDQLESYLQKYREATARDAGGAGPANARIIATAEPPHEPTFPKPWQTVLLSTLAAFLASTSVAAAATLVSDEGAARPARPAPVGPPAAAPLEPPGERARATDEPASLDVRASQAAPPPLAAEAATLPNASAASVGDLVARLVRLKPDGRSLTALVVGGGWGRALPLALETARRLSARGPTVLVDLGATQEWFADILDREDSDAVELPGLVDLLAGRVRYGDIIRRDLSSRLDVVPSGGHVSDEGLTEVLAALASAYAHVVAHASDWRSPAARVAAASADVVVVAAPAGRIAGATEEARAALGACPLILPYAEGTATKPAEAAVA